jgi:hypothetical protein
MKNEKELRFELKHLIRELKGEIRENEKLGRDAVRVKDYPEAAHLSSVNTALDYVVGWLNKIVK